MVPDSQGKMVILKIPIRFKPGARKFFTAKYRPIPAAYLPAIKEIVNDSVRGGVLVEGGEAHSVHDLMVVRKKNSDMTEETCDGKAFIPGQLLDDEAQIRHHGAFNLRMEA